MQKKEMRLKFVTVMISALVLNFYTFMANGGMLIFVRDRNGYKIPVDVETESTIGDVKKQLVMSPSRYLTFGGRILRSDQLLADLSICADSVLEMNDEPTPEQAIKYLQEKNYIYHCRIFRIRRNCSRAHFSANLTAIKILLLTDDMVNIEHNLHVLIIAGYNLNSLLHRQCIYSPSYKVSLLSKAITGGCRLEVIRLMVEVFEMEVNVNNRGFGLLSQCAYNLDGYEIAKFLIANKADINLELSPGHSVLQVIQKMIADGIMPQPEHDHVLKQVEHLLISMGARV